jgi:hypothetical protein
MLKKIVPLILMAGAAQTYTQKKGFGKMKGDLNSDGKMSEYEKKRQAALEKAVAKQKMKKGKCEKCGGKGCSACKSGK